MTAVYEPSQDEQALETRGWTVTWTLVSAGKFLIVDHRPARELPPLAFLSSAGPSGVFSTFFTFAGLHLHFAAPSTHPHPDTRYTNSFIYFALIGLFGHKTRCSRLIPSIQASKGQNFTHAFPPAASEQPPICFQREAQLSP